MATKEALKFDRWCETEAPSMVSLTVTIIGQHEALIAAAVRCPMIMNSQVRIPLALVWLGL